MTRVAAPLVRSPFTSRNVLVEVAADILGEGEDRLSPCLKQPDPQGGSAVPNPIGLSVIVDGIKRREGDEAITCGVGNPAISASEDGPSIAQRKAPSLPQWDPGDEPPHAAGHYRPEPAARSPRDRKTAAIHRLGEVRSTRR